MGKALILLLLLALFSQASANCVSCILEPSQLVLGVGASAQVSPACFACDEFSSAEIEIPCPNLSYRSTIGSISGTDAQQSVLFSSGFETGSGTIAASGNYRGEELFCSSSVMVGGGVTEFAGAHGSSPAVATKVTPSCAGKETKIKIIYLVSSGRKAAVEAFLLSAQGSSQAYSAFVGGNAELSFIPQEPGNYELRVSLGADQSTETFSIPLCPPEEDQDGGSQLAAPRELVYSKTVQHGRGFTRLFEVYSTRLGGYLSKVVLRYAHAGNASNLTVSDTVPSGVLSATSQLSFDPYPDLLSEGRDGVEIEWDIENAQPGRTYSFGYVFERPLTSEMAESFAPPRALEAVSRAKAGQEPFSVPGEELLASLFALSVPELSFPLILAAVAAILIFVAVYTSVFGNNKRR